MDPKAALAREREARVLSIQSHVVHGYAGNKCSVLPLQLHGFEVDFINSVQYSNHAGYAHVKGQKLDDAQLNDLYEGLTLNKINNYSHILTGYCGNVKFLEKIADIVRDQKARDSKVFYVCDPVMGDNGRYYTPQELLPVYRDVLAPLADVLCPNAFELGELTGMTITTESACLAAIDTLHQKGVKTVVVTSGVEMTETHLRCYASSLTDSGKLRYRITFPRLVGQFVGTGDVFASLLLVHLDDTKGDLETSLRRVLGSMQALIRRTRDFAQKQVDNNVQAMCELRLVQSRFDLLCPQEHPDVRSRRPRQSFLLRLFTPSTMIEDRYLPPEEGPFDEDEPLLRDEQEQKTARKYFVMGTVLIVTTILLFISTVAFAALYFNLLRLDNARLPRWPKPSNSPLGQYSTAAVAADNEICSEIGRDVLLKGGNAVDAAVAALLCIGVMDSHSSGIGGGHFMTIYNATEGKCQVLDARETAPAAADQNMYVGKYNESQFGWKAVAVPGEIHGLWTAYQKFGSHEVTWQSLVGPTIDLLKEGYPTSSNLAIALKQHEQRIMNEPTMKAFINPETGRIYKYGEQIKTRKAFLETLRALANSSDPVKTFYDSEMTQKMVDEFKKNGGLLTREDFKGYKSIVRNDDEVIVIKLANQRSICGPPPPSSSAVTMGILNVMDGFENTKRTFADISLLYHRFIEASKFAYAQRSYLGDLAFEKGAMEAAKRLISSEWGTSTRNNIGEKTRPRNEYGGDFSAQPEDHGTTHISVMDKHGNVVSVTSTINLYLGAVITSESTGVLWNDEMDDFSTPGKTNAFGLPPSKANYIKPGKRPMSSQSPLVIYDHNKAHRVMGIGAAGGSTIISGVAGAALHALWLDANPKEAIDAPRVHDQLYPNYTSYEEKFPKAYVRALEARGHIMNKSTEHLAVVTSVEKSNASIWANSDFRKGPESAPAGY
ncbi:unnamed protein product, partial [Mesorhabditis belari]|uniref:pyridoxal kinase n=1 Tax=Mesorhabditis belari TaxID=2138241 RepID=A0AAF3FH26_9BILA